MTQMHNMVFLLVHHCEILRPLDLLILRVPCNAPYFASLVGHWACDLAASDTERKLLTPAVVEAASAASAEKEKHRLEEVAGRQSARNWRHNIDRPWPFRGVFENPFQYPPSKEADIDPALFHQYKQLALQQIGTVLDNIEFKSELRVAFQTRAVHPSKLYLPFDFGDIKDYSVVDGQSELLAHMPEPFRSFSKNQLHECRQKAEDISHLLRANGGELCGWPEQLLCDSSASSTRTPQITCLVGAVGRNCREMKVGECVAEDHELRPGSAELESRSAARMREFCRWFSGCVPCRLDSG